MVMARMAVSRTSVKHPAFGAAMRRVAVPVALVLASGGLASAQTAPASPQQQWPSSPATSAPVPSPQTAADQRINALQTQLHITSAQMPQWSAFAQAMRDNAASTDTLFRQRAGATGTMTALENMRSYAQVARTYAENTEALAQAFEVLYGVLTPEQQQTVDTLFRQQPTQATATQPYRR
jgi:hypothetical protein